MMNEETVKSSSWDAVESQRTLIELLRKGVVTVEFTKVNGEFRSMECTLDPALIPSGKYPKELENAQQSLKLVSEEEKKSSNQALRVFDTEKQEWRSFRWSSITAVFL